MTNLPLRCITIGNDNGPIIQGPAELQFVRVFHTGELQPTGFATIKIGTTTHTGRLIKPYSAQE
ncbi:MAG: hypothetical protein ACPG4X_16985 [Pikeienuella sp.]